MTFFYWFMVVVIVGTFVPSVLFLVLYAATGEDGHFKRARSLFTVTRLFTLIALNTLIWGHLLVSLWQIWTT
jgi:hypothetical protein